MGSEITDALGGSRLLFEAIGWALGSATSADWAPINVGRRFESVGASVCPAVDVSTCSGVVASGIAAVGAPEVVASGGVATLDLEGSGHITAARPGSVG